MRIIETWNLLPWHYLLSVMGMCEAIVLISMIKSNMMATAEKDCFRVAAMGSYAILAAGMALSSIFGFERQWQPWPPMMVVYVAIDIRMLTTILSVHFPRGRQLPLPFSALR